eukprot:3143523-Heterocapsa_arctica.AAC.1
MHAAFLEANNSNHLFYNTVHEMRGMAGGGNLTGIIPPPGAPPAGIIQRPPPFLVPEPEPESEDDDGNVMVRPQVVASEKRDYPEIAPMHKVGKCNYIKQVDCSVILNIAPTDCSRLMAWH